MRSLLFSLALVLGLASLATPADAAGVRLFVRHDVADYAVWRKAYDDFGVTQKKMGVTAQSVYRNVDKLNDITVIHDFKSLKAAKAFMASEDLKSAMMASGVKGMPKVWITTPTPGASGKDNEYRMFVHHEVASYAAWRKVYNAFMPEVKKAGVTSQAVFQAVDDKNDVVAYHDFASLAKAKALATSPELRDVMQKAGVKGMPDVWFTVRAPK